MSRFKQFCAAVALAVGTSCAQAALDVSSSSYSYFQNFDSLPSAATAGSPPIWMNDATLAGWSLFDKDLAAISTFGVSNGSSTAGSFYSYGSTGSSERALGGLGSSSSYFGSPPTDSVAGWIAVAFTNNSGATLTNLKATFDGEQWRDSSSTQQQMSMQLGYGSSFASVSSWMSPGDLFNWTSPSHSGAGATSGNLLALPGIGGSLATVWRPGETLWLRWAENNDPGSDHGLAIDNLSFSVTAVPEPETYAMMLVGLGLAGSAARRRARP